MIEDYEPRKAIIGANTILKKIITKGLRMSSIQPIFQGEKPPPGSPKPSGSGLDSLVEESN
jgi:hypothetical protein